jgi:integrase
MRLLASLAKRADTNIIFPSRNGKALSDMALSRLMIDMFSRRQLEVKAVPHGFRSTFRDWSADQTSYPDEIRKAASGHNVGDAVKDAYQRTDLLDKRRNLMNDWANFLDHPSLLHPVNIVSLNQSA